jgi:small conductance mechanosensitive channel
MFAFGWGRNPVPSLAAAARSDDIARSASDIWHTTVNALPRIGVAVLVIAAAWGLGRFVRAVAVRGLRRRHTPSFSTVMAKLAGWSVTAIGVLLALAVTFPSVQPVDLLAGLGFFSVAIGFAFQDILENLLAGILLLFRQPFVGGDEIKVGDDEGTVERITIRETVLTTFDGERILIPNADVYKSAVHIHTAHPFRRTNFAVGVAYEADLDRARSVARDALAHVDGVLNDPPPEALIIDLTGSTVDLDVRFWSSSTELDRRRVLDRAIGAVKSAFDDAGIEMPAGIVALEATSSFAAALHDEPVTPGGAVARTGDARATQDHPR